MSKPDGEVRFPVRSPVPVQLPGGGLSESVIVEEIRAMREDVRALPPASTAGCGGRKARLRDIFREWLRRLEGAAPGHGP